MLLPIVMYFIELLLLRILLVLWLIFERLNLLWWLILPLLSLGLVVAGTGSLLEHPKHILSGQSLNHAHELFDPCSDSFTIKDCHKVAD